MVEAVTSSSNMTANPDDSPNIVDRITGKLRTREEAEAEHDPGKSAAASKKAGSKSATGSSSEPSSPSKNKNIKDDLEF
jgi:hypothetical protein